MKLNVRRFVSMEHALTEIRPFVNGDQLHRGKPLPQFGGLRPREIWANWLLCAALNGERPDPVLSFTTDPEGSDGIIYDEKEKAAWRTEHVMVPLQQDSQIETIEALIASAVKAKQKKGGVAYAEGKTLLVFLEAGGNRQWHPNKAAKFLPPNDFDNVWVVSLQALVTYELIYNVALLTSDDTPAPVYQVRVDKAHPRWAVVRTQ